MICCRIRRGGIYFHIYNIEVMTSLSLEHTCKSNSFCSSAFFFFSSSKSLPSSLSFSFLDLSEAVLLTLRFSCEKHVTFGILRQVTSFLPFILEFLLACQKAMYILKCNCPYIWRRVNVGLKVITINRCHHIQQTKYYCFKVFLGFQELNILFMELILLKIKLIFSPLHPIAALSLSPYCPLLYPGLNKTKTHVFRHK